MEHLVFIQNLNILIQAHLQKRPSEDEYVHRAASSLDELEKSRRELHLRASTPNILTTLD